jgi:hypothetical protein
MGRAMLNICIVFAQLERETIQRRVQDAYYSRCQKGFHMSGKTPYGYKLEPFILGGVRTKKLVADPETSEQAKLLFEMYAEPQTSFGDIVRHFSENNIAFHGGNLQRATLSNLLRNPIYAQADLEMYDFFKAQGAEVVNEAADFAGLNGCYLYQGRGVAERKHSSLKDQILVIAPHEGLVDSQTWLAVRKKLMSNAAFSNHGRKAKNTWLAGKIKCGRCGAGLVSATNAKGKAYCRCHKRLDSQSCAGCGTLRTRETEAFVYDEMRRKMADFQTLSDSFSTKANPKLTALNVELAQVETDIENLVNTLTGANTTLLSYANTKIEELDERRQTLTKKIADVTAESVSPEHLEKISGYLDDWENVGFEDRRLVLDGLISLIRATSENILIEWKV